MEQEHIAGLEIDADDRQQRRDWVVERLSWIVLALLLIGVACGLFGRGGPLSTRTLVSADSGVRMQYERFVRHHSPDALHLAINASAPFVRLRIGSDYLRHIQIDNITPRPYREISEDGAVTYLFEARPQSSILVTFHFAPGKYGHLDGWLSVNDGPRLAFSQFVYP